MHICVLCNFYLEILSVQVAPLIHSACMRGKSIIPMLAPWLCTAYTMRGKLVFNQLAPQSICAYICTTLRHFFYSQLLYTRLYIHAKTLSPLFQISRTQPSSIELNTNKILSILWSETSFRIPETRAFIWYQILNDPLLVFESFFSKLFVF